MYVCSRKVNEAITFLPSLLIKTAWWQTLSFTKDIIIHLAWRDEYTYMYATRNAPGVRPHPRGLSPLVIVWKRLRSPPYTDMYTSCQWRDGTPFKCDIFETQPDNNHNTKIIETIYTLLSSMIRCLDCYSCTLYCIVCCCFPSEILDENPRFPFFSLVTLNKWNHARFPWGDCNRVLNTDWIHTQGSIYCHTENNYRIG